MSVAPDIAVQKAVRARLVGTNAVTSLVPAASILDINQRPAPMPSIIIGEGQTVEGERLDRSDHVAYLDIHVWKKEPGLRGVKEIAGAIRAAINGTRLPQTDGVHFADCRVSSMRFLRDPDGESSHALVEVEAIICEVAP